MIANNLLILKKIYNYHIFVKEYKISIAFNYN